MTRLLAAMLLIAAPALATNTTAYVGPLDRAIVLDPPPPWATTLAVRILHSTSSASYGVEHLGSGVSGARYDMTLRVSISTGSGTILSEKTTLPPLALSCPGFDGQANFRGSSGAGRFAIEHGGVSRWAFHVGRPARLYVTRGHSIDSPDNSFASTVAPWSSFWVEMVWH